MKGFLKFLALFLAILMMSMTACTIPSEQTDETSADSSADTPADTSDGNNTSESVTYNIIFALATVPPVLASMDAIANGHETYAIIERGKTYNGIDSLEYFHNAGFDATNNQSTGFTSTEFNTMVDKVKELKATADEVFFNIYVQDGTALKGAAIAANAELSTDQFHIIMCEDGTGAYNALQNTYVKGNTVTAETDEVYEAYAAKVEEVKAAFERIMAKTDNQNDDEDLKYNIGKAYALAALDNFTYWLQDASMIVDILEHAGEETETKLLTVFGVDGYEQVVDYTAHLKYQKISEGVAALTDTQRTDYLTLMYGQYYADTYAGLTRTERAGEPAPAKKLVFIGSRHSGYADFATNAKHGIGGLSYEDAIPASYAELDAKYKTELLFSNESDYNAFLSVINNPDNYTEGVTDELKHMAQIECFNHYIDYIYTLKLTFALYGEEYDIIMKGHPREAIGGHSEWGSIYRVDIGEGDDMVKYYYDKLMDNALLSFHANDSTGKYFGMVPYGTSAENLAYLGVEIAICGLPSSTYSGYDTDVDVLFILAETNEDIEGSGSETPVSQVKARYLAGNLLYTDKDGNRQVTKFLNTGNVYKALSEIYAAKGNTTTAEKYSAAYTAWLEATYPDATDIDDQGFPVK